MVLLPLLRRNKVSSSVLDVPLSAYDPVTGLPESITVGGETGQPLLSLQEAKDHLSFLIAIDQLQNTMPAGEAERLQELVRVSARPYAYWAQEVLPNRPKGPLNRQELPGLGVLMAWHAHLLNPTVYEQDRKGAYKALKGLDFPLRDIAAALSAGTLPGGGDQVIPSSFDLKTTRWSPGDIAAAVQRQAKFVRNLKDIGWLEPDHWVRHGWREVQFGIVLYHAWLDLQHATRMKQFLVPRLDIDLAWHTHQLQHERYRQDTTRVLGGMLNHDDSAEEGSLELGLQTTRRLWKKRYGYNYQ
ncbi:hypothetical protein IAU60_004709 [Kwoniella sp. DSM 27419]